MTNLQKIQQETEEMFEDKLNKVVSREGFMADPPDDCDPLDFDTDVIKSFIHSRESIAYKAGYDEGYADCANDVKKLSK